MIITKMTRSPPRAATTQPDQLATLNRMDATVTDTQLATRLRTEMADRLRGWNGVALPSSVDAAMRAMPREAFLPADTPAADAYARSPVVTHRDAAGVATSSASAPGIVAAMLAQLDVREGQRILEVGAGTGYNAALLAQLLGPRGHVTTVDLDPEVAAEAERALAATGYDNVTVIAGDGEYGHAPNAPYDRIIVTAGAWDLPDAWVDQLAPDGLLVVPLRMRGITRSITFEHAGDMWRSQAMYECGFMPIRGAGAVAERNISLGDTGITIRIDDSQPADANAVHHALADGPTRTWTGIEVAVLGDLDFWLAGLEGITFARLLVGADDAGRAGLVPPIYNWGAMVLISADGSFAYLIERPGERPDHTELGACGYGPSRELISNIYAERIRAHHRANAGALRVEVRPVTHSPAPDALMQITKRSTRVIVRS